MSKKKKYVPEHTGQRPLPTPAAPKHIVTASPIADVVERPVYVSVKIDNHSATEKHDDVINTFHATGYDYVETLFLNGNTVSLRFKLRDAL